MKSLIKNIIFLSALILGVSCQKTEVEALSENVKIFVDIEEELTRVSDDGSRFVNGDQIKVLNTSRLTNNSATFTLDGNEWPTDDVILWNPQVINEFHAWHPANASFEEFDIPEDQSEGLGQSDWMTASAFATPADGGVKLTFKRHLTKVAVEIVGWGEEYPSDVQVVDRLDLISLHSAMTNDGEKVTGNGNSKFIQTYVTQQNKPMVAIIAPGTYQQDVEFMKVYVNGNTQPLTVTNAVEFTFKPNMAYTLKLKIGKDGLVISSDDVSVNPWGDEELGDQDVVAEAGRNELDYVDEYGVNHGQGVEIDGVIWAPVNCGYHATDYKYGKLYQWGRKYGQGYSGYLYDGGMNLISYNGSDTSVPTISEGAVLLSEGQSESLMNVFFTALRDNNWDWLYPHDETLWNAGQDGFLKKAEYDPCPLGWRVPSYTELSELYINHSSMTEDNTGTRGYWFSGQTSYSDEVSRVFFPAAGYRISNGNTEYRGCIGRYWSSTPYSSFYDYAYYLNFTNIEVTMNSYGRAYGFSVRCVKE